MIPSIVIVNHGLTEISDGEIAAVAAALQRQILEHFAVPAPDGWGSPATVRSTIAGPALAKEWEIGLFTDPDQANALGYHDITPNGTPLGKVFPRLDAQDGVSWSSTVSHEDLELLADPMLALCFQAPDGRVWAGEVCDAVEATSYQIDGVYVSNFVRPSYFQAMKNAPAGGYDFLGLVTSPGEILAGGYGQWLGPNGWTMDDRGMRPTRRLAYDQGRSRAARRLVIGAQP